MICGILLSALRIPCGKVGDREPRSEERVDALDSGEDSQLGPAARNYVKAVTDASATFDRRKDTILGLV